MTREAFYCDLFALVGHVTFVSNINVTHNCFPKRNFPWKWTYGEVSQALLTYAMVTFDRHVTQAPKNLEPKYFLLVFPNSPDITVGLSLLQQLQDTFLNIAFSNQKFAVLVDAVFWMQNIGLNLSLVRMD